MMIWAKFDSGHVRNHFEVQIRASTALIYKKVSDVEIHIFDAATSRLKFLLSDMSSDLPVVLLYIVEVPRGFIA